MSNNKILVLFRKDDGDDLDDLTSRTFLPVCQCNGGINEEWETVKDIKHGCMLDCEYIWLDYVDNELEKDRFDNGFPTGMVWCYSCNGRFVIDLFCEPVKISKEEAYNIFPNISKKIIDNDKYDLYTFGLATILRMSNDPLLCVKSKDGSVLLPSDIAEIAKIEHERDIDQKFLDSYNLIKKDKCCKEFYCQHEKQLSLPVNSYDFTKPHNPYPTNINLNHDGVDIKLHCRSEETGETFDYLCSGD